MQCYNENRVKKSDSEERKVEVPVQRARKFSAVLGTTSAKSCNRQYIKKEGKEKKETRRKKGQSGCNVNTSMTIRSRGAPPMETSKNTLGFFFLLLLIICYTSKRFKDRLIITYNESRTLSSVCC